MKLPFGLELIKSVFHPAAPVKPEEKEKSVTSYLQQVQGFGMRLSAYDYAKDNTTLTEISKYNPWIASSIRAITRNSIQPMGKTWDPKTEKDITVPDFEKLMAAPHPYFTQDRFRKYVNFYYAYFGIAFIYKIRMDSGKLIALQPLPSDRVQMNPTLLTQGIIAWQLNNGAGLIDLPEDNLIVWMDDEFIDSYYTGGSKLRHLLFSVANKNGADRFNKATIENGGEFKGVLYTEQRLNEADIDLYDKQLKKRYGGPDKAGKTAIFGSGLKYEKTGATIAEMAFNELQKVSREEVLAVYKVPPVELGLTESVNYANAKEQRKLFWETTLIPTFNSYCETITRDVLQKEFKTTYEYYFDYSAIPAMQQDLAVKLQSGLTMQLLGYDNETITSYLDLPEIKELEEPEEPPKEPPKEEPAKTIIIPNRFKSVFRDSSKELFGKTHTIVEIQFRRLVEKHFMNWRNDVLDRIRMEDFDKSIGRKEHQEESDPQERLLNYIRKRTDAANTELKKIGAVMYSKVNDQIVKKMTDQYGLKWVESARSIITENKHLENFTLVNDTVDEQLKEAIKEAYLRGLSNNASSGEMADLLMAATRKVYKLADTRALLIARTETTSAANDLMLDQYHENEVEAREWLTARDGDVRSIADGAAFDHQVMDNGQAVPITEAFKVPAAEGAPFESMMYPGDMSNGSPGNVCNCFIPDTICEGNFLKALKANYTGPVREIVTRRGYRLTTTINHPIMTDKGWVASGQLDKGMNVIAYAANIGDGFLTDPDYKNNPSSIQNIFNTFLANGRCSSVVVRALDFHGDAEFIQDSQIDVVSPNLELPLDIQSVIRDKTGNDFKLIQSGALLGLISINGTLDASGAPIVTATPCDPSALNLSSDKRGLLFDFGPFKSFGFGTASDWYTGLGQASKENATAVTAFVGKLLEAAAGNIALDEIVEIRDYHFSGHVYDLQSIDDYILSNGILSSNCRCTTMPV